MQKPDVPGSKFKANDRVLYVDEPEGPMGSVTRLFPPSGPGGHVQIEVVWDDDPNTEHRGAYREYELVAVSVAG